MSNDASIGGAVQTLNMTPFPNRTVVVAALRELWLDLLSLLWPCACLVCGAPNRECCARCTAELRGAMGHAALVRSPAGEEIWGFGVYDGALRTLLIAYKHGGSTRIAKLLGDLLSGPLRAALCARDGPLPPLIVTIPSRPAKVRERGFRHVDLMVRRALRSLRGPGDPRAYVVPRALQALPGRTGQVGLQASRRERNAALVRVPKRMRGRLRGREVVLVDDIVTTGATLQAAARALAAVEVRVIGIVVLGVTKRRSADQSETRSKRLDAEVELNH